MKLGRMIHEVPSGRILLAVLAILFAFCGGPAYAASEPGAITIVVAIEPHSLDPAETPQSDVGPLLMQNVLEALTEINIADSSIVPGLATSWKQIDGNTWHFLLRKGVKFHDGKDFNAEAVIYNIKRLYDKRINSRIRAKYFPNITLDGKALDSHTLELKTNKAEPLLPYLLGFMVLCSPDTPLDKWTRNPIGTGPYKMAKWDAGMQVILERFDGYWGMQPSVKKAVYIWRNESSVRAAMVAIGEADFAPNIAKQDANRPDMDSGYLNTETTTHRIGGEWEPPFNDKRVRMALNLAVDRNAIRGTILSKDAVPASQVIGPNVSGYNPDLKVWPYDPQKAKQLIDEARKDGVPVDKEMLLVARIGQFANIEDLEQALINMYKAVGLNFKLKMVEQAVYISYRDQPFPKNIGPYIAQFQTESSGDAGFTVFHKYHCKGSNSNICDKTVDDLIEKAQGATGEQRKKLWQMAFKRITEEIIPEVMLFHMVAYCRVGKRIDLKPSPALSLVIKLSQVSFRQ